MTVGRGTPQGWAAERLMRALAVVVVEPANQPPSFVAEVGEVVLPDALLLEGTEEALDETVLLGVGSLPADGLRISRLRVPGSWQGQRFGDPSWLLLDRQPPTTCIDG